MEFRSDCLQLVATSILLALVAFAPPVFAIGVVADLELGQVDLTHGTENFGGASALFSPAFAAVDLSVAPHRFYVSDTRNHRVLAWKDITSLVNGSPADLVLGQPDFFSGSCNNGILAGDNDGLGPDSLCFPQPIAVDAMGNVYVSDGNNNRVLEYNQPFAPCQGFPCVGPAANLVFGQGATGKSFTTNACADGAGSNPPLSATGICTPGGVAIDSAGNVFIGDFGNNRVLEYNTPLANPNAPNVTANLVFGQGATGTNFTADACADGFGSDPLPSATGLCLPFGLAFDSKSDLYVADLFNNRVLEYNQPLADPGSPNVTANLVFGQGDTGNNLSARACANGIGGNPAPSAVGLCSPNDVKLDSADDVYVVDADNNRVLKYDQPLADPGLPNVTANLVYGQGAGGSSFTTNLCANGDSMAGNPLPSATGLCFSSAGVAGGEALDTNGDLYVTDTGNNRVLKYASGTLAADVALGQIDLSHNIINFGGAKSLDIATSSALDQSVVPNRFYVADEENSRVLGWSNVTSFTNGASADLVLGQPDFSTGRCFSGTSAGDVKGVGPDSLCFPEGVAVDKNGNLYVADSLGNRVLEFNQPFAACQTPPCVGPAANLVFGQGAAGNNFSAVTCADGFQGAPSPSATAMCSPNAVALDAAGNLYVSDSGNNRVLEFNTPLANPLAPNVTASVVFGQGTPGNNFSANACADGFDGAPPTSATGLCVSAGVALDSKGNLFISDEANSRVLEFNAPLANPSAPNVTANLVFGQGASGTNFSGNSCNGSSSSAPPSAVLLCEPKQVALDSQDNLFVADSLNNRVLKYNVPLANPGAPNVTANLVYGQGSAGNDFTDNICYGHPFLVAWSAPISGSGLCAPDDAIVDQAGNVYIADTGNSRIAIVLASVPPTPTPTATPTATATATATATPTATPTATATASPTSTPTASSTATATTTTTPTTTQTPTATPTPISEKLTIKPSSLAFGAVTVETTSKPKTVTIKNAGSKKTGLAVNIEMESASPSIFAVTSECKETLLPGKSCKVSVTFKPTDTTPQTGGLTISDNVTGAPQEVSLSGTGKAGKKK